jgi:BspA type Leucine rich repeat region (6 copies)
MVLALPISVQAQFTFITNNGAITITGDTNIPPNGVVFIPSSTNGYPVTSIGSDAFDGNKRLVGLIMPNTITNIGVAAFSECTNLVSVTIPAGSGVNIGQSAFAACFNLVSLTIPDVTALGPSAFTSCINLPNVTFSAGLTNIGDGAFSDCNSLTNVCFEGNAPSFGKNVFIDAPLVTVIFYVSSGTGWGASYDSIPIEPCVACGQTTPDPYDGFYWTQIGEGISITNYNGTGGAIVIPATIAGLPVTVIGGSAFFDHQSLTNVTIPDTVTNIGQEAFYFCTNLAGVSIGNSVASIGAAAFGNTGLTNVTVPSSVTSIGLGVFSACPSLTAITVNTNNPDYSSLAGVLFNGNQSTLIQYPWGRTGAYTIPSSVTSLGEDSFNNPSLTGITIPNSVTNIGLAAFSGCTSLTNVTIPGSVTSFGLDAFGGCYGLVNVTIDAGVTTIGPGMFALDYDLVSVTIPGSVTTIQGDAFSACYSLTNVTIPDGVASIQEAFPDCSSLTSLTIPASVTNLDYGAFMGCSDLSNVCFQGSIPISSGGNEFGGDPVSVIYYVFGGTGWGSTYEGIPTAPCAQCGVPSAGELSVTINPPCVVLDGAKWQVDSGVWQNSGAVATNLAVGNHTISFTNLVGWITPSNQTVQITGIITNMAVGNYIEASSPGLITWINIGGVGNWSSPTNWDLGHAPNSTNVVLIPNTGGSTCLLDVDATVAGLVIGDCAGLGSDGLSINGHILAVNGPLTIQSNAIFVVDSGVLTAVSNNLISGVFGWTAGSLDGTLTMGSNSVLNITGTTFDKNINCVLTNYGTVNWSNDQLNGGGAGTIIYNYGLWNAHDDQSFGGAGTVFNNYGIFRKSGGANVYPGTLFQGGGPSGGGVLFNQVGGVLDVQNGTNGLQLTLQGGANFSGGFVTTNSAGVTVLSIGNFNINGTTTCSNVVFGGTSLVGANVIRGGLTWQNGSWDNAVVTVSSNTILTINSIRSDTPYSIHGCVITNYGVVNWSANAFNGDGGTAIYNYGLWNAQDNQYFAGSGAVFNNYGTFLKSGGVAGYPGTYFTGGGIGDNTTIFNQIGGILSVQTGDVTLGGTYSLTNGTLNFGIINATNNGVILAGSVLLGGSLSVNVNANYTPAVGDVIGLIGASALTGTFSHLNVPAGMSVVYSGVGVSLNVTGPVPVQILNPIKVGTNVMFQFPTAANQSYTIQQNTNLATTNWTFFTNIVGSGSLFQFQTPSMITPAQNFFRVREP